MLRLAGGKLRFRLRDVGARYFADIEPILGLLQGLFEHAGVAALNLDDGGVAQIIHIDRGCAEQNGLFENPQALARARDLALRRAGFIGGLIAVVERLGDGSRRR